MTHPKPHEFVPETSDQGRREFTMAMQLKIIGDMPRALKRFGVSLDHYKRVIAEIHFQVGDCLFKENDWVGAAAQFELALQNIPNHLRAQDRLESCRHLIKRSIGAKE
ncbi:MAG: tetratricopeptide repeat protein [Planctomycetota bacterium]